MNMKVNPEAPTANLPAPNGVSTIAVHNPATGGLLYTLPPASAATCHDVMERARSASCRLRNEPVCRRLEALAAVRDFLARDHSALLEQIVAESGRCLGDALLSDLFQLREDCRWLHANAASILDDETLANTATLPGKTFQIFHEPHGVVLVISPWNLPLAIAMTAAMFAFVAGNAVVLKPSEHTPMAETFARVRLLHPLLELGLHVVHGRGDVAEALIAERPDLICFTGSVATGKKILAQAAPLVIPTLLELGATDAMVVWSDADLTRAVPAACWGNLHNSGQSCTATERIFVHTDIYDLFVQKLVGTSAKIRLGTDSDADLGVLTTDAQLRHVEALVEDARRRGARVLCGGRRSACGRHYLPTVITETTASMRINSEEIFGPVVTVKRFASEAEVVAMHNAAQSGLSTSIWTRDPRRSERLSRKLATGCINVNNVMMTEGNPALPFGGVKYSGYGRMKGREGLLGMTRSKAVLIDDNRGAEPNWYPYSREKLSRAQRVLDALDQQPTPPLHPTLTRIRCALEASIKGGLMRRILDSNPLR